MSVQDEQLELSPVKQTSETTGRARPGELCCILGPSGAGPESSSEGRGFYAPCPDCWLYHVFMVGIDDLGQAAIGMRPHIEMANKPGSDYVEAYPRVAARKVVWLPRCTTAVDVNVC